MSTCTGHLDWHRARINQTLDVFISLADRTERFQELCIASSVVGWEIPNLNFREINTVKSRDSKFYNIKLLNMMPKLSSRENVEDCKNFSFAQQNIKDQERFPESLHNLCAEPRRISLRLPVLHVCVSKKVNHRYPHCLGPIGGK